MFSTADRIASLTELELYLDGHNPDGMPADRIPLDVAVNVVSDKMQVSIAKAHMMVDDLTHIGLLLETRRGAEGTDQSFPWIELGPDARDFLV